MLQWHSWLWLFRPIPYRSLAEDTRSRIGGRGGSGPGARPPGSPASLPAEEMFDGERLDFVDVATRPDSHLPLVRLAAGRKTPVICQKSMAPT